MWCGITWKTNIATLRPGKRWNSRLSHASRNLRERAGLDPGRRAACWIWGQATGPSWSDSFRPDAFVAEGVEKNPELVARCIQRGLVVHQGNIAEGLDQYGDQTFDYVLLLGTFQELISPEESFATHFAWGAASSSPTATLPITGCGCSFCFADAPR